MAASFSLILTVVTEMFLGGARFSLGKRLIDAQMLYNIGELYALIMLTGIIGYMLNLSFIELENRIVHWRDR